MAIKKQEFYEGAALHLLARSGDVSSIRYDAPFFLMNGIVACCLKYCTKGRSPWGFTFAVDEQTALQARAARVRVVLGLVCGADGVAAIEYDAYQRIASPRMASIHIACYRQHREYFAVIGPDGELPGKVAPSEWQRILDR
jgi:hypothetical protein